MNNPFQEQLLKAGVVTKEQVKKANQEKQRHKRQQPKGKKQARQPDPAVLKAKLAAEAKAQKDRELNQRKQEQARKRAVSAEIDQLIRQNMIKRDEHCDLPYNFEHKQKVHRLYVNAEQRSKIIDGKMGIARIEGRYELVPLETATKIRQRNEMRVVILEPESQSSSEDDPYAGYEVPDDLMW